jgi:hypothetical protein
MKSKRQQPNMSDEAAEMTASKTKQTINVRIIIAQLKMLFEVELRFL